MGAQLGSKGAMSEINMTPLIDIVLVVLIIMMVNVPIQIEEMGLKLPGQKTTNTPPPPDAQQLVIAIYEDGSKALNRRIMSDQSMLYELTRRLRPMTKKNVFVDAHFDVTYGDVIDAVDLAKEAGAANVGLARAKEGGPIAATEVEAGSGMPRGIFLGSPSVRGEITEKKADASIQPLKTALQNCYLQALAGAPALSGHYTVYVEIGPQGELLSEPIVEKDSMGIETMQTCILEVLPNLRYEPLGEQNTAWVRYPILFSPG